MKYYSSKKDTVKKVSLIDELGANISYNMAAATRPWSDLGLNLRLKLSKNYTFSMSSSFKTYGYKFDKNGNVVPNDRTEWSYGRLVYSRGTVLLSAIHLIMIRGKVERETERYRRFR